MKLNQYTTSSPFSVRYKTSSISFLGQPIRSRMIWLSALHLPFECVDGTVGGEPASLTSGSIGVVMAGHA